MNEVKSGEDRKYKHKLIMPLPHCASVLDSFHKMSVLFTSSK